MVATTKLFSIILLFMAAQLNAAVISIERTDISLGSTRSANLQGLEWLSLDHTAGLSRKDIEVGFIDNYGNTWSSGEWRYATLNETKKLIFSLWDGVYLGESPSNYIGADWFRNNLGMLSHDEWHNGTRIDKSLTTWPHSGWDSSLFFYGAVGECHSSINISCQGMISLIEWNRYAATAFNIDTSQYETTTLGGQRLGSINDSSGLNTGVLHNFYSSESSSSKSFSMGSLLVREAIISEPSIIALMLTGILGLGLARPKLNREIKK